MTYAETQAETDIPDEVGHRLLEALDEVAGRPTMTTRALPMLDAGLAPRPPRSVARSGRPGAPSRSS